MRAIAADAAHCLLGIEIARFVGCADKRFTACAAYFFQSSLTAKCRQITGKLLSNCRQFDSKVSRIGERDTEKRLIQNETSEYQESSFLLFNE
jgi:hypothetical protein